MQHLYVGTNRFVIALDPRTGDEQWRTRLTLGTAGCVVHILIKDERLFVGSYGRAYCLERETGEIVWENKLPKTGFHAVLLAMTGAEGTSAHGGAVAAECLRQQEAAADGAATCALAS